MSEKEKEKVVIIIPSQGSDTGAFEDVAKNVKHDFYAHATIVKAKLNSSPDGKPSVTFSTLRGAPFSFDRSLHLSRVITISHAMNDGPNLAFGAPDPPADQHQPWGYEGKLNDAGKAFWQDVSKATRADGKILLLGCNMGHSFSDNGRSYAQEVAEATGRQVFASTEKFGAGNSSTVSHHIKLIEHGKTKSPLKAFSKPPSL